MKSYQFSLGGSEGQGVLHKRKRFLRKLKTIPSTIASIQKETLKKKIQPKNYKAHTLKTTKHC